MKSQFSTLLQGLLDAPKRNNEALILICGFSSTSHNFKIETWKKLLLSINIELISKMIVSIFERVLS